LLPVRRTVAALFIGALVVLSAAPAVAQQTTAQGTSIGQGLVVQGATISGPCKAPVHELNSVQAAAFVQTFLGNVIFRPELENPPASLPVCRVSIRYTQDTLKLKPMQVDFATDGKKAWVAFPPQSLWAGVFVSKHVWALALPSAPAAFAGKGVLQPVTTPAPSDAPTARPGTPATRAHHSSSSGPWIAAAVLAGLVLLGAVTYLLLRRNRDTRPQTIDPTNRAPEREPVRHR
jgi:hypothetical protein